MIEKTTGNLIAFHKHLIGIKQGQLAFDTGIPQNSISKIENDKISPTVNQLLKISHAFNISPSALLPADEGDHISQKLIDNAANLESSITKYYGNIEEERKIFRAIWVHCLNCRHLEDMMKHIYPNLFHCIGAEGGQELSAFLI